MSVLASVCVVFHPTRVATLYDPYTESLWPPPPPHPSPPLPPPFVSEQKYYLPKTTSLLDDIGGEILRNTIKRRARIGDEHNTHDDSGVIIISGGKGNEDNSIKKCRPTVKTSLPTQTLQPRRRASAPTLFFLLFLVIITRPYPVISIAM